MQFKFLRGDRERAPEVDRIENNDYLLKSIVFSNVMPLLYVEITLLSHVWLVAKDGCHTYFRERYEPVVFRVPIVGV